MHDLRWGEAWKHPPSESWDWLVDEIEMDRVQATISNFPVEDRLLIDEAFLTSQLKKGINGTVRLELNHKNSLITAKVAGQKQELRDRRYSPGFLVPLVLAALSDAARDDEPTSAMANHIQISKRLCDKGCLALAIASLCSGCSFIRRLAVAVIAHFSVVLHSPEARKLESWRERPQIAMMLKALKRGMTVRKKQSGSSLFEVEKLPGLSAIFLARACLVLSRPSDPVFPAVNQYFLRTGADHGAFQDFLRVPGFVSMFCSDSEDGRAQEERLWAIRLVRDGFVDEDSYRPLAACHAIELFLSSIDGASKASASPEREIRTIFDALQRIIDRGGKDCITHVVGRLGILHWFRSILTGYPLDDIFRDFGSREAFLKLVGTTVNAALHFIPAEELQDTCESLVQPLLGLYTTASKAFRHSLGLFMGEVLVHLSQAFESPNSDPNRHSTSARSTGYELDSALKLLTCCDNDKWRNEVLVAFCILPFQLSNGDTVAAFCREAFRIIEADKASDSTDRHLSIILGRLNVLLSLYQLDSLQQSELLTPFVEIRKCCFLHHAKTAWLECSRHFGTGGSRSTNDSLSALVSQLLSDETQ